MAPAAWDTTRESGHLNDRDGLYGVEVYKPVSFDWVHFFIYSIYAALSSPRLHWLWWQPVWLGGLYRYSSRILIPIQFFFPSSLLEITVFSSLGLDVIPNAGPISMRSPEQGSWVV